MISAKKVLLEGKGMEPSLLSLVEEGVSPALVSRFGLLGDRPPGPSVPSVQRFLLPFWSCVNLKLDAVASRRDIAPMRRKGCCRIGDLVCKRTESFAHGVSRPHSRPSCSLARCRV